MMPAGVFKRSASGLVRQVGFFDNFMYCFYAVNVVTLIGYGFPVIWAVYPGGSVVLGLLIDFCILIPFMLYFWLVTTYMPRTGAFYVFESRALHPIPAFAANWNWAWVNAIAVGMTSTWMTTTALTPLLVGLGLVTHNTTYYELSATLSQPIWIFAIAVVCIILAMLMTIAGFKYLKYLSMLYVVAMIGIVIAIVLLAATPPQTFVDSFNSVMSGYAKTGNPYEEVIQIAANNGFTSRPFDWLNTFQAHFVVYGWIASAQWSGFQAGEIKNVKKSNLLGFFGAMIAGVSIGALFAYFVERTVGYDFLVAMSSLSMFAPDKLTFPAIASGTIYPMIIAGNAAVALIIGISMMIGVFLWMYTMIVMPAKCMFSWSFDRLIPDIFARIERRTQSALYAILLVTGVTLVAAYLYVFTQLVAYLTLVFGVYFIAFVSGTAAILFPWRRKEIFDASPARYKIFGVPLISILGVIILTTTAITLYAYIFVPKVAFLSWPSMPPVIATWVSGIAIYLVARWYYLRQGIPFDLQFKELPPA